MLEAFLLFGVFLLIFGGALALVIRLWILARRNREALQALAGERGWTYREKDRRLPKEYKGFRPFGIGSSRIALHVMDGHDRDRRFRIFQYQYTVSNGKSSTTYRFAIIEMHTEVNAHPLSIEREHLGHKIIDALGGEDIDFESHEFSKRFWVQCTDRKFAYDVIDARMMEYLLQHDETLQWAGPRLIMHKQTNLTPAEVDALLARAHGFLDNVPRHLHHS